MEVEAAEVEAAVSSLSLSVSLVPVCPAWTSEKSSGYREVCSFLGQGGTSKLVHSLSLILCLVFQEHLCGKAVPREKT